MTTTYRPILKLAIPEDVTDKAGASRAITQANIDLAGVRCTTRQDAIERAAVALHNSGAGACAIPSAERVVIERRGQFYRTTVGDMEFGTNLSLRGFWAGDRQIDGTTQRSFATLAAFRRHALKVYRERYAD